MPVTPADTPSTARTPDPRLVPGSVYAAFMLVWFFLFVGASMGAANASSEEGGLLVLFLAVLAYPVVALVSTVASRRAVRDGRVRAARVWNLLPLPWVVAGAAFMVWALS